MTLDFKLLLASVSVPGGMGRMQRLGASLGVSIDPSTMSRIKVAEVMARAIARDRGTGSRLTSAMIDLQVAEAERKERGVQEQWADLVEEMAG